MNETSTRITHDHPPATARRRRTVGPGRRAPRRVARTSPPRGISTRCAPCRARSRCTTARTSPLWTGTFAPCAAGRPACTPRPAGPRVPGRHGPPAWPAGLARTPREV